MRYLLESIGPEMRQYFVETDLDGKPFNRLQRSIVYQRSKKESDSMPFGTQLDVYQDGYEWINHSIRAISFTNVDENPRVRIGSSQCEKPYNASLFNISAMSFGSLSKNAIIALNNGAKQGGFYHNTGEGGLSPYHLQGGADIVFQIGTAKFGVRKKQGGFDEEKLKEISAHTQVKMFEIKLSQGAKPGKGGILPGVKVNAEIAAIRGLEIGQDAISPNRHPEINNVDDLLDMVNYVRDVTGKPVGFKMVVGAIEFFDVLFSTIIKRGIESAPDFITIDSSDGGTGAAPMSLIDNMGMPLKESLPMVVDKLISYELRDRIKVCASGKLINPSEATWGLCMGADFVNSARGFMFALGCIQSLQCNKNTCPTGITTHNKKLQYGLNPEDKAVRVMHYAENMLKEIGVLAHSCGVAEPRLLNRNHARMVLDNGKSISMMELYPEPAGSLPAKINMASNKCSMPRPANIK